MCGIVGGYDRQRVPFGEAVARAGCSRIAHRGPDDEGWFESQGVLLGNRRLSILDLAGGHQPMFSDDGQIAIVQNGEIYNFVELARGLNCRTHCDTEVILKLYERDGEGFVTQLNGMFAIAIFDRRERRLLLYRDRLGKKPLYWHDDGRRLMFASEVKSLLAMGVRGQLDVESLDAYLTFNYVPPPRTIFRGVTHLPPGHMLRLDDQGMRIGEWWRLDQTAEERPAEQWEEELLATMQDAVRLRLRSDVPVGAFLSGGLDSSLVVRCMSAQLERPVRTFCIGLDHGDFDDARFAAVVAQYCGTEHTSEFVTPDLASTWPLSVYYNDQPHGDVSFLPTYWVSQLARRDVKVVLTGDGSDELFAGYDVYRRFMESESAAAPQAEFERAYIAACSIFSREDKEQLYTDSARRLARTADLAGWVEPYFAKFRHQDRVNQLLGVDINLLLAGNNLVKPDKMAMAVGLETRAPFLDYRLVELAFRIPGTMKLHGQETKAILKRAAERVLPSSVIYRPKQMFTLPVADWFRTRLLPFVQELLLSRRSLERGFFERRSVARMVEEHISGRANHARRIRALIALELWQRVFLDASFDHAPSLQEIGLEHTLGTARLQPQAA